MNEGDEILPIKCPYCPDGDKEEFYDARGVDSHFYQSSHPDNAEPLKERIQQAVDPRETEELPTEQEIIETWLDKTYPETPWVTEVPVQTQSGNRKYVDIVVFERWPFASEEEATEKALQQGFININTGDFVDDAEKYVKFILQNANRKPVKVRLFEAKRALNFKSIGQILAYSEFFPQYYGSHSDGIEIVEKGIIYRQEDEMCFKTAEQNGITLHPIS